MAAGVIRQTNATGNRVATVFRGLQVSESAQNAALTLLAGHWPTADRLPRQHAAPRSFEHCGRALLLGAWLPRPSELADRLPAKL